MTAAIPPMTARPTETTINQLAVFTRPRARRAARRAWPRSGRAASRHQAQRFLIQDRPHLVRRAGNSAVAASVIARGRCLRLGGEPRH
jgi:hypothetical protein